MAVAKLNSKNPDPLHISNEMLGFDVKDRKYYSRLTDEQKKKFSTYLMLRFGASVSGSADMQAYYLMATNENVNKHFFEINKHPELQWLCCTTVSPGLGQQFHYWLGSKKSEGSNKIHKFLLEAYPNLKLDEIELLEAINDTESFKDLARKQGYSDKQIADTFGK